jgi:cellulose synthase/poly-beta-1,6-N-acetylglucosamine synthase-like glycosyltransferase
MLTALLIVGAVFTLLGLHPFVTYPISLWMLPRTKSWVALPLSTKPSISICMSAYNEERVIVAKIESLIEMAREYGPASIHVYVDGSTDETAALLAPYSTAIDLVISTERKGKTFGLNSLLERSQSELLMFTDANVLSGPEVINELVRPFADGSVGCVTARLNYSNRADSPTSAMGSFYWSIEETIKQMESATVGVIGVDGAMFMIRRSLYRPAPPTLIDDLYVSLNVLIQRSHIVSVESALVEERSAVGFLEEFQRKRRIACQAINVHKTLWRDLKRMAPLPFYGYISHRLLKWLSPFFLLISAMCLLLASGLAWTWRVPVIVVAGGVLVLLAGNALRLKPVAMITSALLLLAGVAIGVLQSLLTSETYTVWNPAASVRRSDEQPLSH